MAFIPTKSVSLLRESRGFEGLRVKWAAVELYRQPGIPIEFWRAVSVSCVATVLPVSFALASLRRSGVSFASTLQRQSAVGLIFDLTRGKLRLLSAGLCADSVSFQHAL